MKTHFCSSPHFSANPTLYRDEVRDPRGCSSDDPFSDLFCPVRSTRQTLFLFLKQQHKENKT